MTQYHDEIIYLDKIGVVCKCMFRLADTWVVNDVQCFIRDVDVTDLVFLTDYKKELDNIINETLSDLNNITFADYLGEI